MSLSQSFILLWLCHQEADYNDLQYMSQLNLNVVGATELMFISSILIPTIGLEIPFLLQLIFFENE